MANECYLRGSWVELQIESKVDKYLLTLLNSESMGKYFKNGLELLKGKEQQGFDLEFSKKDKSVSLLIKS